MCFRSDSLGVYSCISASVSARGGSVLESVIAACSPLSWRIRRWCISNSAEIYEAFPDVCREELDIDLVADVHALLAADEHSLDGRADEADECPARVVAGNDRLESLA